ncbi:LRMP protein, partial [Atractosteus spatula]|nr:LRMP protein [Atractosteus spatula]
MDSQQSRKRDNSSPPVKSPLGLRRWQAFDCMSFNPLCGPNSSTVDRNGHRSPSVSECSTAASTEDFSVSLHEQEHQSDNNRREVMASTVMQYLQSMTAQSPEQGRLSRLYDMLDPDRKGVCVNRDVFQATMKRWISQCSQDCESRDMINTVADLRHANHSLSEQNSSLIKAVEACDEKNLQLTAEVSKLKRKLMSQERACRIQTYNNKLKKENECLRAQIQLLEEANEKLAQEKSFNKTRLGKLMKMQSEMRKELDETQIVLASKDREITQKTMLIEELKFSQMENHRIIEVFFSFHVWFV